jgi:hypothetical protein
MYHSPSCMRGHATRRAVSKSAWWHQPLWATQHDGGVLQPRFPVLLRCFCLAQGR